MIIVSKLLKQPVSIPLEPRGASTVYLLRLISYHILFAASILKMSTQYTTDIPFSASNNQQAFKLLELPPDLLALLESDNPPRLVLHEPSAHQSLLPLTLYEIH
jgi:hypothetical protein